MSVDLGLDKLFFELASESRLSILQALLEGDLKLQEVAKKLDVTATEALRQLERLSAASMVQRQPEGAYAITAYGKLVLQLSAPLNFLLKHREFFLNHDLSMLPAQFISRLGELSGATLIIDTMESLNKGQRMFMDAQEFGFGLAEGVVPELMGPVMEKKVQGGLKFKFIIPKNRLPPNPLGVTNMELRGLEEVPLVVAVTEKEAAVCFRLSEGRMDYAAFYGSDAVFRGWAMDLFLFFWKKSLRI